MTRRLPNTNEVVELVKSVAAKQHLEKQASAIPEQPKYKTNVAVALHKVAVVLREADLESVSYDDVARFYQSVRTL